MNNESIKNLDMASPVVYQVMVQGKLADHWADWFDATVVEHLGEGKVYTILTCQVRDQAELLGILNRLNGMNLPLCQMIILDKKDEVLLKKRRKANV